MLIIDFLDFKTRQGSERMELGTPIAEGNTAKIYLVENRVVKVFKGHLPDTEAANEARKQKYAHSCGLSVPEIFDVTEVNGKQAIMMEYINGKTMGEILFENKEQAEYYMSISVGIQHQIHSKVTDSLEPMSEKLSRQIKAAPGLSNNQRSALLKRLETLSIDNRLCHGDFHLYNLIKTNNKVTIIDWVDASVGDMCADICRTYLLYSQFSAELADMYLHLSCKKRGLSQADIFQWAPIIAGARLSETVISEKAERLIEIVKHHFPR